MNRPLVWVGIAYVTGEAMAAVGVGTLPVCFLCILIISTIFAGRNRLQTYQLALALFLPVFFVSGFVVYGHAGASHLPEWTKGENLVQISGRVTSASEKDDYTALELAKAEISYEGSPAMRCGLLIYADPAEAADILPGDLITAHGRLSLPSQASNPGQFDMRSYLRARGILLCLYPDHTDLAQRRTSYRSLLLCLRHRLKAVYFRLFGEEEGAIATAMILGDKSQLPEETIRLYQQTGIIHILAISGLHVSMAGNLLFHLLRRLRAGLRPAALASIFVVVSYGVLTGMSPSTERAVIMFTASMMAICLGRTYDMMSAAALAALILFTRHPLMIGQAGMQFSFGAVCGLGLIVPAYRKLLPKRLARQRLVHFAGPSLVTALVTMPVTAWHYYAIPVCSLPLNLVVIPAMSLLMPACLLAGLAGLLWLPAGAAAGGSAFTLLRISLRLCQAVTRLPFSSWVCGRPPVWVILLYYSLLLLPILYHKYSLYHRHGSQRQRHPKLSGPAHLAGCAAICIVLLGTPWQRFGDRIAFLDVGQGDCIYLRCRGTVCLVDGGSSNKKNIGKNVLEPFLLYQGNAKIDYAFVSHADLDHISGIRELLQAGRIRRLVLTKASAEDEAARELASLARQCQTPLSYVKAGDAWSFGDWDFTCLYPDEKTSEPDRNDLSMVLQVQKGRFRLLLTGDISSQAEQKLKPAEFRNLTILKCAHHGSRFSSGEDFLQVARPILTIISCAQNNRYGHPAPETVERLTQAGSRILYTMKSGAILIQTDGRQVRIKEYLSSGQAAGP